MEVVDDRLRITWDIGGSTEEFASIDNASAAVLHTESTTKPTTEPTTENVFYVSLDGRRSVQHTFVLRRAARGLAIVHFPPDLRAAPLYQIRPIFILTR